MATVLGTSNFDTYANYQLAYDLLSQDTSTNSSRIRLYGILNVTGNSISWSSGSASVHTESAGIGTYYSRGSYTVIQRDFTFGHDSNGNFSEYIGASINTTYKSGSCGGVLTLPKINRVAKTDSVEGTDIDGNFKVNYTKYILDYTYKLRISIPNVVLLERIDYNTSGETFTLSSETLTELYSRIGASNSISLGFAVETYSGGTKIGDGNEIIITGRLLNANPIFSNFIFEDINATTVSLTGSTTNNVINVNGYSTIYAVVTYAQRALPQKGATISKYRLAIGEQSVDFPYNSEGADPSGDAFITNAVGGVYDVYAIDSRNNSTLVTKLATQELAYTPISLDKQNCSLLRDDNQVGENAELVLNGSLWNNNFGIVTNSITSVTYRLKKTDSSTWITGTTTITPTVTNNTFTFTGQIASDNVNTKWDLNASYNLEVTISDELSSATAEFILNSAIPTLCLDKQGLGVMCAYDSNIGGSLQVDGKIIDGGTILWTNSSPSSLIPNDTNITIDDDTNYDILGVFYKIANDGDDVEYAQTIKGYYFNIGTIGYQGAGLRRRIVRNSSTSYTIKKYNGETLSDSGTGKYIIPIYIIGYKTNLFS